jgi:uncharacterized membrane protein YdjX (TVP38/TMEM64 family)
MIKIHKKSIIFITLIVVFSLLGYSWLVNQPFTQQIASFAQIHRYWLIIILVLIKVVGLVYPPLLGGIFNLAIIPFLGWQTAYIIDLLGTIIGAGICYVIAFKWGYKLLIKILDEDTVRKIIESKVKNNRQVEFSFVITIMSRFLMTEISYYAAGILKLDFKKFMFGAISSHLIIGIPSYYLTNMMFETKSLYLGIVAWIIIIPTWLILKDRYFESSNV